MSENRKEDRKNIYQRPVAVVLLSLLACFLWGSAFPSVKIGFELFNIDDTGSKILFAGYRFFIAGIVALVLVSIIERKFLTIKRSSMPHMALQGLIQTTLQYIFFYIGLSYTTGAEASIIDGSCTFFSIIFAWILLKEKMSLKAIIGCVIGFCGIILINYDGSSLLGGLNLKGDGLLIMCTMTYGLGAVTSKIYAKRESPNAIAAYQLLFGGFVLIVIGMIMGGKIEGFTLESTLVFIYLAMIPAPSYLIWGNLLKYNPVGKISIFCFTVSIFGVLLSTIFLGENTLNFLTLTSLFLVSSGIIIVNREPSS